MLGRRRSSCSRTLLSLLRLLALSLAAGPTAAAITCALVLRLLAAALSTTSSTSTTGTCSCIRQPPLPPPALLALVGSALIGHVQPHASAAGKGLVAFHFRGVTLRARHRTGGLLAAATTAAALIAIAGVVVTVVVRVIVTSVGGQRRAGIGKGHDRSDRSFSTPRRTILSTKAKDETTSSSATPANQGRGINRTVDNSSCSNVGRATAAPKQHKM